MGIICQARQKSLDRIVALKLIRASSLAKSDALERFRLEAAATARLRHPGIVAVHEVGEHDGLHFYTMDFIAGRSLAAALRDGPFAPRRAAECVRAAARAIHFAHEHGVIHRDLKPSNILLDAEGEPRVTDFGLAKLLESDSDLTMTGAALGSPSYMPPEQASGRHAEVSRRSDVYSLGAILYECLTGRPPFSAATPLETMKLVTDQEPISPRVLNATLPRDLETICLKCLQKNPTHRYASADALAEDLTLWLRDKPILARPSSIWEIGGKWVRRNPAQAALLALTVVAAAGSVAQLLFHQSRLTRERNVARQERQRALEQEQKAIAAAARASNEASRADGATAEMRQNLYAADMLLAQHALDAGDLALARRLVAAWQPKQGRNAPEGSAPDTRSTRNQQLETSHASDVRAFEWRYLWKQCQGDQLHSFHDHASAVFCVAFSRDGKLLASGDDAGTVCIRDVASRRTITTLAASKSRIVRVSFSADGRALAIADKAGGAQVWDLETGKIVWTHQGRYSEGIELSPQGTRIGVTRVEFTEGSRVHGSARVIDWTSGKELWHLGPTADFEAFSPDGKMAVVSRANDRTEFWEMETGRRARTITNFTGLVFFAANAPRMAILPLLGAAEIPVFDLHEEKPPAWWRLASGHACRAALSPDGTLLAAAASDQVLRVWNVAARREVAWLKGHTEGVNDVTFSPDGQWLATAGTDRIVMLWSPDGPRTEEVISNSAPMVGFVLSPDGRKLAGCEEDSAPRRKIPVKLWLWDLATRERTLLAQEPCPWPEFFSDDSRTLCARAGVSATGLRLLRWDLEATNAVPQTTLLKLQRTNAVAFTASSPGQNLYAVVQNGIPGVISLWNPFTGEALGQLTNRWQGNPRLFSPDGRKLLSFASMHQLRVTDLTSPAKPALVQVNAESVLSAAFSPEGQTLALGCSDHTIRLWEIAPCREMAVLAGHQERVGVVAFSPDGRTLASSAGRTLKLWSVPSQRPVAAFPRNQISFCFIAFTPDGRTLVAGDWSGQIHLWRVPTLDEIDSGTTAYR